MSFDSRLVVPLVVPAIMSLGGYCGRLPRAGNGLLPMSLDLSPSNSKLTSNNLDETGTIDFRHIRAFREPPAYRGSAALQARDTGVLLR